MRQLREYRHVARQEHWCDRCCNNIHPGETYTGQVFVCENRDRHGLVVFKTHSIPGCDYPEEPDCRKSKGEEFGSLVEKGARARNAA